MEVRGEPVRVSVCHCYACQRRTGSVFGAQARFPAELVTIEGSGTEFVRVGDEGGRFRYTFCLECGSTVFYIEEGREEHVAIPVGAFADSSFPPPTFSVYEEGMHPWAALPTGSRVMTDAFVFDRARDEGSLGGSMRSSGA